ncbi:MAG: DMT family transporter [Pseudomonadota bacterium]
MTDEQTDPLARRGVVSALIAFCCFPIGDTLIKTLAGAWSPLAVASLRFCIGALGFGVILFAIHGVAGFRVRRPVMHVLRGAFLALATATFFSALFVMPLADAAAIQFINPLLTAVFAVVFLGERLPVPGWIAIALGFAGVLIMLRPTGEAFGWAAILPLFSALGVSGMIVLNRLVATQSSIWTAQFYMAFWASVFLMLAAFIGDAVHPSLEISGPPEPRVILVCFIVAVTAGTCHYLLYSATISVGASAIAPIVYIQLPIAAVISNRVFGDPIDDLVFLGGLLILASGIYLWLATGGVRQLRRAVRG